MIESRSHDPYVPMGAHVEPEVEPEPVRRRAPETSTGWVWFIAAAPLAVAVLVWLAVAARIPLGTALLVLMVGSLVGTFIWADKDRAELQLRELEGLPSPYFAIVPLVWLFLRAKITWPLSHQGHGPIWLWLGGVAAFYVEVAAFLPVAFALQDALDYWRLFRG
jgi:hypothetical protein